MSVNFLDPGPGAPHETLEYDLRLRPSGGSVRIGLLANGFPDSTAFLEEVRSALREQRPEASFVLYTKPRLGTPITEEEMKQRFAGCNALVVALGHCGSCTAASTRDAALIARCGLPVVLLVTEVFHSLSKEVAYSVGLNGLPVVILPHPLAGTGRDNLKAVSARFTPDILQGLVGSAA
jgi:hypothetical protein